MRFLSPKYLTDAFEILDKANSDVLIGAGMTHLLRFYPNLPEGLSPQTQELLHIGEIQSLAESKEENGKLSLGSTLRFFDLESDMFLARYLPGVWESARQTSTPQIRNRRSLGGEVVWGSSHSPLITALLTYNAQVKLRRSADSSNQTLEEVIPLEDFYTDNIERVNASGQAHFCRKTSLNSKDLLLKISIPEQDYRRPGHFGFFRALSPKISTENPGVVVAVSGLAQNGTLVNARFVVSGVWMSTLRDEIPLEGTKLKPNVFLERLYQWCDRYPFESHRRSGPSSKELSLIVFGLLKEGFSPMMGI